VERRRVDYTRLSGALLALVALFLAFVAVMFFVAFAQTQAVPPLHPSERVPLMVGVGVSTALALCCVWGCVSLLKPRSKKARRLGV
jgi:EamA domain-containing membrane protein RarD